MRKVTTWVVPVLLIGTTAYCIAEELTLTTYYPSPRGVYQELRTQGNVQIGTINAPGEVGGPPTPVPRLYVKQEDAASDAPLLQVESTRLGSTPVVIDKDGNVGIGTTQISPGVKLRVEGAIKLADVGSDFAANPTPGTLRWSSGKLQIHNGTGWAEVGIPSTIKLQDVPGPSPACPAGSGAPLMRKWASTTCGAPTGMPPILSSCDTGCTTPAGWVIATQTPSCAYAVPSGPCGGETCTATSWTEVICLGN